MCFYFFLKEAVSVYVGDFNARNSDWWSGDTSNLQGTEINNLATQHGLHQIIDKPTHILSNSASCIDLIFTSTPNLVCNSGVLPSLFSTCKHQLVYARLNFQIPFPPAYKRKIWDFSRADFASIREAMNKINWDRAFLGLNLDDRVLFLNNCILNVCSNFVPNKVITIRNKDALWMTPDIKRMILEKAKIYRRYVKNGRNDTDYQCLRDITSRCRSAIKYAKDKYFLDLGKNLNNPNIGQKKYWAILNCFIQKRKIPKIPPLHHNDILVTDTLEKGNAFNDIFSKQCSLLDTNSELPPEFFKTDNRLNSIAFNAENIVKFIRTLNENKAHGWDGVSVRRLKLCDDSLAKPLLDIFVLSLNSGKFPNLWKRGNIVPVHKKGSKSCIINYRPVSLLPIFSKIFEKCIYDTLYNYFEENALFSSCQSGFRKGDSCISQLLSITHDIYKNFDANPTLDTRGVFLDISKAFDRVWHKGLIFKLKSYGIVGSLLCLLDDFLSERFQRVVLSGKASAWKKILAGVPQGSILGPLLFLIFINDLPDGLESVSKIFADDTSLFSVISDVMASSAEVNRDLQRITRWAYQWKMSFNPDPTKQAVEVLFSCKRHLGQTPNVYFNNIPVARADYTKHLGLVLDSKLVFDHHIAEKILKANKGVSLISRLRKFLSRKSLLDIYKSFVRPHLDYGDIIYDNPGNSLTEKLESVQYNACLAITGCFRGTSRIKLYSELGLESLADRRFSRRMCFFYKILNGLLPRYLFDIIPVAAHGNRSLRSKTEIRRIYARTDRFARSFFPYSISQWNNLDSRIKNLPSISRFKRAILNFVRPTPMPTFNVSNNKGFILLTRLRVGFSHLAEHKLRHGFLDLEDPFCSCRTNSIESTEHYLLQCSNFSYHRLILFNDLHKLHIKFLPFNVRTLSRILLYGHDDYDYNINHKILEATINYIMISNRFSGSLFNR